MTNERSAFGDETGSNWTTYRMVCSSNVITKMILRARLFSSSTGSAKSISVTIITVLNSVIKNNFDFSIIILPSPSNKYASL